MVTLVFNQLFLQLEGNIFDWLVRDLCEDNSRFKIFRGLQSHFKDEQASLTVCWGEGPGGEGGGTVNYTTSPGLVTFLFCKLNLFLKIIF